MQSSNLDLMKECDFAMESLTKSQSYTKDSQTIGVQNLIATVVLEYGQVCISNTLGVA